MNGNFVSQPSVSVGEIAPVFGPRFLVLMCSKTLSLGLATLSPINLRPIASKFAPEGKAAIEQLPKQCACNKNAYAGSMCTELQLIGHVAGMRSSFLILSCHAE